MAYTEKQSRVMRNYNTSTIDRIISFTIDGCNLQKTELLGEDRWLDLPKPYIKHDLKKGKAYLIGRHEIKDLGTSILCSSKDFQAYAESNGTIYIEFVKEYGSDINPNVRAEEFFMQANNNLKNLIIRSGAEEYSIKISRISWPSSHNIDPKNKHPYSHYFMFSTNKECIITPNIQE